MKINKNKHKVGERYLVKFCDQETGKPYKEYTAIQIEEWSPSGKAVRIIGSDGFDGPGGNHLQYDGIKGWYDTKRIKIIEKLPRIAQNPLRQQMASTIKKINEGLYDTFNGEKE